MLAVPRGEPPGPSGTAACRQIPLDLFHEFHFFKIPDSAVAVTALATAGKVLLNLAGSACLVYLQELFPTPVRYTRSEATPPPRHGSSSHNPVSPKRFLPAVASRCSPRFDRLSGKAPSPWASSGPELPAWWLRPSTCWPRTTGPFPPWPSAAWWSSAAASSSSFPRPGEPSCQMQLKGPKAIGEQGSDEGSRGGALSAH